MDHSLWEDDMDEETGWEDRDIPSQITSAIGGTDGVTTLVAVVCLSPRFEAWKE